jgi:pimeloyl-ACP methyl ester carboxylesterase
VPQEPIVETQFRWRVGVALSAFLIAACGGGSSAPSPTSGQTPGTSTPSASETGSALPRIHLPAEKRETVEGLVDVDGHDIYARCNGTGSPTVVYFTGWAPDRSKLGVSAIRAIEAVDGGKHRICSYERRNTGRSETVKGTQTPEDIVADVDGVLDALGENGPFVLLGASFGGLVAGAYAVAHPGRTAGILLLDSSIPDDYLIDERYGFDGMCLNANRRADASESLEKIDNCRLAKWAYDRRDQEPDVPLIYLAAKDPSDRGDVADDPLRKAFVRRWSPGVWEPVSAPHWMDEADPNLVVENLERVIALSN